MKKLLRISAFALLLGWAATGSAQTVKKVEGDVKTAGKKVGRKTAEVASKGKARITDQVYKDKVGMDGQTIYMDNHSKYYWIDKKGHRNYVTETELKDKPNQ